MDNQLVNMIVAKVLAELRSGGTIAPQATTAKTIAAPPAKMISQRPRAKVFITADELSRKMAAGGADGGVVELAAHERLTPSAQDLVATKHLAIRRAPAKPQAGGTRVGQGRTEDSCGCNSSSPTAQGALGIIIEREDAKVRGVIQSLAFDGVALADYRQGDCWITNFQTLCDAIRCGAAPAGVAVLPYAADAMVLAGKINGIRPVQGTRPASVEAAVRRFDANLLVIEHVFSTYHEMRRMIRAFAQPRQAGPTYRAVVEKLSQLEGV